MSSQNPENLPEQNLESRVEDSDLREKRLSESQPFELERAFKQVLKDPATEVSTADTELSESTAAPQKKESTRDYLNSFNLFADIFYGVLVAPRETMLILSDHKKYPATFNHISQAVFFVVLVFSMVGWLRFKFDRMGESAGSGLLFTLSCLGDFVALTLLLYYLGIFLKGGLRFGNALVTTAWAFLPFVFFAPILCYRHLLGNYFLLVAMIPAMWFLGLLFVAYQSALKTTPLKMLLLVVVVPPLFAVVYGFWLALAFSSLAVQILPRLLSN